MSRLDALHASCARLRTIGQGLRDADLVASAYPTEWTVADVFSHLGSSATIFGHFFDDVIESREPVEGRHQRIWDEWNAKAPSAHVEHCLIADGELLARLEASDEAQRAGFEFSMGPISVGFDGFVGLRLNEHAMHTWDIEVAFDPSATIPAAIADHVVDNLALTARFSGRAGDVARTVGVATTDTGQA
ncbi:MAG: maleylpyruvate isomerase family mycothiol-dependent enzyme, partial [Acidimicrobiales bacterium]